MKEIITIQLGNCGNTLGSAFWEELSLEHGILPNGIWCGESELELQGVDSFFLPGALVNNYVPRCVLIDLDPNSSDSTRISPYGQLFRPDNFILGRAGSGNNFARGRYADGRQIQDQSLEAIRRETEACDWPVGFQMLGALGGGTGSGVGALLMEVLRDEYPKYVMTNYTIMPGGGFASDAVVEPLNAVLACPNFIKYSDLTICMDNQCLYDLCQKTQKLEAPIYSDINKIVAKVIAGLSATYRFPSRQHVSWETMKCMLVPSPKLHFFVPGYAPLNSRGVQQYRNFSAFDVTYQLLHGKGCMLAPGLTNPGPACSSTVAEFLGKYITAVTIHRGYSIEDEEVTKLLSSYQDKNIQHFCDWMQFHFLKGICNSPPKGQKVSATSMVNHTGAQRQLWGNILGKYRAIYNKKAFIHWYFQEGMSHDDFRQADEEARMLIEEYKGCETEPPFGWEPLPDDEIYDKCWVDEVPVRESLSDKNVEFFPC